MPTESITVRLPAEVFARLDALAERLGDNPTLAAVGRLRDGHLSRAATIALAVVRGLEFLEREYAASRGALDSRDSPRQAVRRGQRKE